MSRDSLQILTPKNYQAFLFSRSVPRMTFQFLPTKGYAKIRKSFLELERFREREREREKKGLSQPSHFILS